jgi:hypothetical protein
MILRRWNRKLLLMCVAAAALIVSLLFFGAGTVVPLSWSNALLPGLLVSALLLVHEKADFGTAYFVVGLALDTVIYGALFLAVATLMKHRTTVR